MERRIFIAIVVSIAFLWIWAALAPKFFPELARKPAPAKTTTTATTTRAASPSAKAPASATVPTVKPAGPITPIAASSRIDTIVDRPEFVARFSNRGAQLVSFRLKKYLDKTKHEVELVKARTATKADYPFAVESAKPELNDLLNHALWAVNERRDPSGAQIIEYRYAGDGFSATKTFQVGADYQFNFNVSISPAVPYRVVVGPGLRTLTKEELESKILITGSGVVQRGGSFDVIPRDKGDRLKIYDEVDFVGMEDNYFLAVLRPQHAGAATLRRIEMKEGTQDARRELYAGLNAAHDGVVSGSAFFGPKETKLLDRHGLGKALQFGMFGIIARFLLEALVWVNTATKNYGFAIIVLTIIIKVVLYPLQHKSIVSMKKMQKVQPKMEAIKAKYKKARTDPDQRQKMNVEMMKLYQVEGINPMSGCLPIVLQLPILWGFYNLLSRAIELRGAPFMLWIQDLSDKDPYYVTPLLMTITMFIQTWITPATGDPAQRRIFLIMPLVFGWIFKEMPSGLVLYWLVQNILTIAQQMIMNKWWKEHPSELQQS
jgi:YidC/Oxa1 family membrane protein insertase